MSGAARLIARDFAQAGSVPHVVRAVFPDPSPAGVAAAVDGFCRRALGSAVDRAEFSTTSVGSVHGLRLADGRRVVVKVHGPRVAAPYLWAVRTVQERLAARGFPAPRPLAGPLALGRGVAMAEELVDGGGPADAHRPDVRRVMATALARLVDLARPFVHLSGLRGNMMEIEEGRLWPLPHDGRFDFEATAPGAAWIDRIAARARPVRDRGVGPTVVGHLDWRAEHVRVRDGRVTAVYDWDSLSVAREPLVVGSVAHAFTVDWASGAAPRLPSLDEALGFVADYEQARARPFSGEEGAVARASVAYAAAYGARCEHADVWTGPGAGPSPRQPAGVVPDGTARAFLARHASDLLGEDVGPVPAVA